MKLFRDISDSQYNEVLKQLKEMRAKHPYYRDDQLLFYLLCNAETLKREALFQANFEAARAERAEAEVERLRVTACHLCADTLTEGVRLQDRAEQWRAEAGRRADALRDIESDLRARLEAAERERDEAVRLYQNESREYSLAVAEAQTAIALEEALFSDDHVFHPHGIERRFVVCATREEEGEPPCDACLRVDNAIAASRAARDARAKAAAECTVCHHEEHAAPCPTRMSWNEACGCTNYEEPVPAPTGCACPDCGIYMGEAKGVVCFRDPCDCRCHEGRTP